MNEAPHDPPAPDPAAEPGGDGPETVRSLHFKRTGFTGVRREVRRVANGPLLGLWTRATFGEKGKLLLGEQRYVLGRESGFGDYFMRGSGRLTLRASKPSAFSRRIVIRGPGGRRLELKPRFWGFGLDVLERTHVIGRCKPTGFFTRALELRLSAEVALELAVFTGWMASLMIDRERRSSSS